MLIRAGRSGVIVAVKVICAIEPELAVTDAEPAAVPAVHFTLPMPWTSVTTVVADTVPPFVETVKETGMPAFRLSKASVTLTTSELSSAVPTLAVCPSPPTSVSLLAGAELALTANDTALCPGRCASTVWTPIPDPSRKVVWAYPSAPVVSAAADGVPSPDETEKVTTAP